MELSATSEEFQQNVIFEYAFVYYFGALVGMSVVIHFEQALLF